MLKAKVFRLLGVVLCLMIAGAALGTVFTWDGGASGDWDGANEWIPQSGSCSPTCHPHTADDDAVIDTADVTITLTETVTIDDLSFSEEGQQAKVITADDTYTVTCDTITITDTKVTLTNEAGFEADGTEPCSKK